ncbi:hypothetical protein ACFXJ8_08305 [Nonomuraea sp. NPDC059194]|uniref:hypothetical protein n=1 Tax=Nonomuraea sp. NPDC059194 TaxID=3346764 RepID=UPI00367F7E37
MIGGGTATAALGALLDRSLAQIAAAAQDARSFDRQTIHTVADIWDNNTFPLFHAAAARTPWGRERRARAALRWMAALGAERRSWMIEQAALAGHNLEPLLPHLSESPFHGRSARGKVLPRSMLLTAGTAAEIATDYDMTGAEVLTLLLEREGSRLTGTLTVAVPRRYETGRREEEPAKLHIWLTDITEIQVDSRDAPGITLATDANSLAIGIGTHGTLRAAGAEVLPRDWAWHLSTAGRAADARTPPADHDPASPPPRMRPLEGASLLAARLLHGAMTEIRMTRFVARADQAMVRALSRAFAGAGTAVVAARREAAYHRLIETWMERGGPTLVPWFTRSLRGILDDRHFHERTHARIAAFAASSPLPTPTPNPISELPPRAELRLARYTAAHTENGTERAASAVVHLAVPSLHEGIPWRLQVLEFNSPARFQIHTAAFRGPCRPRTVDASRSLTLDDEALVVSAD